MDWEPCGETLSTNIRNRWNSVRSDVLNQNRECILFLGMCSEVSDRSPSCKSEQYSKLYCLQTVSLNETLKLLEYFVIFCVSDLKCQVWGLGEDSPSRAHASPWHASKDPVQAPCTIWEHLHQGGFMDSGAVLWSPLALPHIKGKKIFSVGFLFLLFILIASSDRN